MKTRFKRLLRLRDVEFFNVVFDDERTAYLLFYDERHSQKKQRMEITSKYF